MGLADHHQPRHFLLIRKHLHTRELVFHYAYVPPGKPVTLMALVRGACLRWPVEEDFEFGKDHFGLDHSQVRLHTALARRIVLTLAALAVTVAQARTRASAPDSARHPRRPAARGSRSDCPDRRRGQTHGLTSSSATCKPKPITCTGSGGDDATRPAPAGSITAPGSAATWPLHDEIEVRLPY